MSGSRRHGFPSALVAPRLATASPAMKRTLRDILVRRGDHAVRVGAMSRRRADALLAGHDAGLDTYPRTHHPRPPSRTRSSAARGS